MAGPSSTSAQYQQDSIKTGAGQLAWKKESDTAAHHPIVTAPMTMVEWPERLTGHDFANLVWGVISRAATMSASYRTDYLVTAGTLANLAGDNWRHWVDIAIKAGYLTPAELDAGGEAWLLVEDSDDLFHIRRKAEIEWETRRKKDNSTPSLIIPVRLRDGDGCRYCGVIVNWRARRGGRAGTYDHRLPGQGAESPEDLRVACAACNGKRRDLDDADSAMPPLPPPTKPFYGEETAELLAEHGHKVPLSNPPRPRTQRDTASKPPSDPAASRTPHNTTPRPGNRPDPAPAQPAPPATPPPAGPRTAPPATPKPSEPRTAPSATPPPAGHRTARPGSTPPTTAPHQHKPRSADRADRRDTPDRFPGRDGNGSGSGREPSPPVPATGRKRSRGRRGRSRSQHSPPAQPTQPSPAQQ